MQPIQITLHKRLNQHKLTPAAQASLLIHFANRYLTEKCQYDPQQVQALAFKHSVLWVGVAHPILAQEIWGISLELLESIRQEYPTIHPSQIRTKSLTET